MESCSLILKITTIECKVGQTWVFMVDDIRIEEVIVSKSSEKIVTKVVSSPFEFMKGNLQQYSKAGWRHTVKTYNGHLKPTFNDYLCKI